MKPTRRRLAVALSLFAGFVASGSDAQEVADPGFKSVGRGAPLAAAVHAPDREAVAAGTPPVELQRVREQMQRYPFVGAMRIPLIRGGDAPRDTELRVGTAWGGATPAGGDPEPLRVHDRAGALRSTSGRDAASLGEIRWRQANGIIAGRLERPLSRGFDARKLVQHDARESGVDHRLLADA